MTSGNPAVRSKRPSVFVCVLAGLLALAAIPGGAATPEYFRFDNCKTEIPQLLANHAAAKDGPLPLVLRDCLLSSRKQEPDSDPPALPRRTLESYAPDWKVRALPQEEDSTAPAFSPAPTPHTPEWAARLPLGKLLRYEQDGDRIVAVVASHVFLPNAETDSYWICISHDGGRRFETPLYTRIEADALYTLKTTSSRPILRHGRISLEVSYPNWERPIVGEPKRYRLHALLQIELAKLRRDSDGDGLANTLERAMTLDPYSRDSDGDGLDDNVDAMPNLANTGPRSVRTAALEAVLNHGLGADETAAPAVRFALPPTQDPGAQFTATFLVGDPDEFRSAQASYRTIVLSPAQAEAIRRLDRRFNPYELLLFTLDPEQQRGVARLDASWKAVGLALHRNGEKWESTYVGTLYH